MDDSRPIGIFDSGVGGLTVLKKLQTAFPHESFLYLGDTARLPYGTKSQDTIERYSQQIVDYLLRQDVKVIVIACNSASSSYKSTSQNGIPIFNVIDPGAQTAVKTSLTGRIGVVGTRTTIKSQAYHRAIHRLNPQAQIFDQACPLWVPLAEEGWVDDPITNLIVYRYLTPLLENNIDTLVLGCTHYPVLYNSIRRVTGSKIELVDSGQAVAEILASHFEKETFGRNTSGQSTIKILATDTNDFFSQVAARILDPIKIDKMEHVDL